MDRGMKLYFFSFEFSPPGILTFSLQQALRPILALHSRIWECGITEWVVCDPSGTAKILLDSGEIHIIIYLSPPTLFLPHSQCNHVYSWQTRHLALVSVEYISKIAMERIHPPASIAL